MRGATNDDLYESLISLDEGTGTVKLMARVVLEGEPVQGMRSVFLVAEAHGVSESHDDLRRCFSRYREEIADIERTGAEVTVERTGRMQMLDWNFLLVADYKVLYSLYGLSGARGSHPCPFCMWPARVMDLPLHRARAALKAVQ